MNDQNATRGNFGAQAVGYRIFLASPGDVRDEGELARAVIEQIRLERAFRERVNLEIIAWDQPGVAVAMEAGLTPQEAIKRGLPQPSECDLVVVILWSRMGTALPAEYTKPDGTAYRSGTEWEYRDAITAAQRSDRPKVWLYRRKQVPELNLEDPEFDEKRRHWLRRAGVNGLCAPRDLQPRPRPTGRLTLQDYDSLGGVTGAIQAQAEKALKRLGKVDDRALHALFSDLVEVNDQGVATRRRASLERLRRDDAKARLADALVDARILVTDSARADNPTLEVAHEAVFTGWRRLSGWVDAHAGELPACRSLVRAAEDWRQVGAPPFRHLPDRATLKQYRKIRPACALGEHAEIVGGFLSVARRRQRLWSGFLFGVALVIGLLGVDTWLRNREMNWTVQRIWALAEVGHYSGPDMVRIPGTDVPFQIGSNDCTPNSKSNECPQHPVMIQTFWMGQYEVTFDEYSAFVLDTDRVELPHDQNWGRGTRPVINVSWDEAKAYAEWLAEVTGHPFRLPTEAEWEYAARAGSPALYWWGDDIRQDGKVWANCSDCGSEWAGKRTMPVGAFQANTFGLHDMHGNVWEWVEDDWHDTYDMAPDDGRAWIDDPRGPYRVLRGGSLRLVALNCRSANRFRITPDYRSPLIGFRLARSVALGP